MFGVTQTTRFKAAVAGAGVANWQSNYGENSIDQWMVPFFGTTVYDDTKIYEKSSAIDFIKNVKTRTLVIVGALDGECPPPQSFEFWHALRAEGIMTQLGRLPRRRPRVPRSHRPARCLGTHAQMVRIRNARNALNPELASASNRHDTICVPCAQLLH